MKTKEKEQAIALRKLGNSMNDIAQKLGVSKSSISLWTRGISYVPLVSEEERCRRAGPKISKTKLEKLLEADFGSLTVESKKKRVVLEQSGKCLLCGISEWRGNPLTIAVDHVDGNNQNDSRENLRGLCPNCHSQTDTYCGKNRGEHYKKGQRRVTDERLLAALLETKSIAAALRSVGITRNRDRYDRCKELLSKHNASHLVDLRLSECGFCGIEIAGRPREEGSVNFCSQMCAGHYVGNKKFEQESIPT